MDEYVKAQFEAIERRYGRRVAIEIIKRRERRFLMKYNDRMQSAYCRLLWSIYTKSA